MHSSSFQSWRIIFIMYASAVGTDVNMSPGTYAHRSLTLNLPAHRTALFSIVLGSSKTVPRRCGYFAKKLQTKWPWPPPTSQRWVMEDRSQASSASSAQRDWLLE